MIGIGKTFTGVFVASLALVVAFAVGSDDSSYHAQATIKTQRLLVNTDGQDALVTTFGNGLGTVGNLWIGAGGYTNVQFTCIPGADIVNAGDILLVTIIPLS